MTFQSHVESGGEKCPKCSSRAIKARASSEMIKADRIEVSMFCATCGARWRDIFTLSKAEDL